MKKILTAKQIKRAETAAFADGISSFEMMKRAGGAVADEIAKRTDIRRKNVLILCGSGNNGGDGFVCARALTEKDAFVSVLLTGGKPKTADAKTAYNEMPEEVSVISEKELSVCLDECDAVVDAVFGFGFHGALDDETAGIIKTVNAADTFRIAVDVPSGAECDTGHINGECFDAHLTVTFTAAKPYCYLYPARDYCGEVTVADVGLPEKYTENPTPYAYIYDKDKAVKTLPLRKKNSHKGTFGSLLMCTGSRGMRGARILSAGARLKSGVGLVYQHTDAGDYRLFAKAVPEAVCVFDDKFSERIDGAKAVVCGCGLGKSDDARKTVKAVIGSGKPAVYDADALNIIAESDEKINLTGCVITPHPAEAGRLLGVTAAEIQTDRMARAENLCEKYGCAVLLKGAYTIIKSPECPPVIIDCANSGLAKGGSGDTLSGIIGALLRQGIDAYSRAALGAYIHAEAGRIAAEETGEYSMQPSDLIGRLHVVFKSIYSAKTESERRYGYENSYNS